MAINKINFIISEVLEENGFSTINTYLCKEFENLYHPTLRLKSLRFEYKTVQEPGYLKQQYKLFLFSVETPFTIVLYLYPTEDPKEIREAMEKILECQQVWANILNVNYILKITKKFELNVTFSEKSKNKLSIESISDKKIRFYLSLDNISKNGFVYDSIEFDLLDITDFTNLYFYK